MAAWHAGAELGERQGPAGRRHRHPVVPDRPRRQGQADRYARRRQRLPRHQERADGGGRLPQVLQPGEVRKEAAATGAYIPVVKGAEAAITDPLQRRLADDLAASTYHQNFFDQDLGPSVGRVINDVSVAVAAGQTTPEAAAAAIQEAADQQ